MTSLFGIGISGLKAQQAALNIVGQNITNASTPGYSRQRADIVSVVGGSSGGILSGAGARVSGATRIADEFIDEQIRTDRSLFAQLDAFTERVSQLEDTLFDADFGLDAAIRDFFDAVQNAANEPSDLASRQFVITSAEGLVSRFGGVTDRSFIQAQNIVASLESTTQRINELAQVIVQFNDRISVLQDNGQDNALNLMVDQREEALKELSQFVAVTTSEQSDGQVNVFVGKGQPMVLGQESAFMDVTGDGDITLRPVGSTVSEIVTSSINGGELGGILDYREEVLWPAQNELGRLAAAISLAFNNQHALGIDLDGEFGGEFFRDVNDPTLINQRVEYLTGTSGGLTQSEVTGVVNVYLEDPFKTDATDYEMVFSENNPGTFTVQRPDTGEIVFVGTSTATPQTIEFGGIRVELASGDFPPGSSLLLRPYADFGNRFAVVLDDPSALALASPVITEADVANQGDARVRVAGVVDSQHPLFAQENSLVPPLLIEFVTDTEYRLLDNSDPANPVPVEPDLGLLAFSPGSETHLLPYVPGTQVFNSSGPAIGAFTSAGGLVSNLDPVANNYPAGTLTFTYGEDFEQPVRTTVLPAGASAREIASAISALPGANASARTEVTLQDLVNFASGTPVELAVNGELLTGFATLGELADLINANETLAAQGIQAVSDGASLKLAAIYGDDLTLHFQGDTNESITLVNSRGASETLRGNLPGTYRGASIAGEVATILDPGVSVTTAYDGVFASQPVLQRADFGVDLTISGQTRAGDRFNLLFNEGGLADNRNALALADLNNLNLIGSPARSFGGMMGALVQEVGIQAGQAKVNRDAAGALLEQSQAFRESVSGVNLDEEAADLIRFEQAYNASAQVLAVARDIFNTLLNSVA